MYIVQFVNYMLLLIFSPRNVNLYLLVQIISFNLFLYKSLKKTETFTGPNKVLLVLGWRTGAHLDDCIFMEEGEFEVTAIQLNVTLLCKYICHQ